MQLPARKVGALLACCREQQLSLVRCKMVTDDAGRRAAANVWTVRQARLYHEDLVEDSVIIIGGSNLCCLKSADDNAGCNALHHLCLGGCTLRCTSTTEMSSFSIDSHMVLRPQLDSIPAALGMQLPSWKIWGMREGLYALGDFSFIQCCVDMLFCR